MQAPTSTEAGRMVDQANHAQDALASRGRWIRTYLLVFAGAALVVFPLIGLGGSAGAIAATSGWIVLVALMSWWASRQPTVERGGGRRNVAGFITWGILYGVGLVVGMSFFRGEPAYWLPVAVVVAAPLAVAALYPARS